jgi:hypothetical protein
MKSLSIPKTLAQIILYEGRQLILIAALLLSLVYKHFQPGEFISCSRTLEQALKFCTFKTFSVWKLVDYVGKSQWVVSKTLILIAACGWLLYLVQLLILVGLRINRDREQPPMAGIIKITVLSTNLYLIYNLLIKLFSNGTFPHFQSFGWDLMFWWTFGCYCIPFLFYISENRKGLTDGSSHNIETRSNPTSNYKI